MRLLVLGGTRSGKSDRAEGHALSLGRPVVYVATAGDPGDDAGMTARVAAHRARRPDAWRTVETDDPASVFDGDTGSTVLVDDLGGWVTARLDAAGAWNGSATSGDVLDTEIARFVDALRRHPGDAVLVSPEVGLGVVPDNSAARLFTDVLGTLNQHLARECDHVELIVAGRVLDLRCASGGVGDRSTGTDELSDVPATHTGAAAADAAARPAPTTAGPSGNQGGPLPTPDPIRSEEASPGPPGSEEASPGTPGSEHFPGSEAVRHYADPVLFDPIPVPSMEISDAARARHLELTKPAGSLGGLEDLGVWVASCQGQCPPTPFTRPRVVVFAGDHGVAAHGVSAFPREVTVQMVATVLSGGAAVSVLARASGATVRVADIAVATDCPGDVAGYKVRRSSGSIDREDALTHDEVRTAVAVGRRIADEEIDSGADLLVAGDLGIGNTTPATTLIALLTGAEPVAVVGRGTGVDDAGWMRKTMAVRDAMFRCRDDVRDPVQLLRRAGGADLAAMAGFLAQAALRRTPVLLDGSVVTSAALVAEALAPGARGWWRAGHLGAEPGHRRALEHLALDPLVDFGMRLGEGSGAVAALPLVHAAVAILSEMATFADAGVSGRD